MLALRSRPLVAAVAVTVTLLLLAAGHRHQTGHWAVSTPGTSWSQDKGWSDAEHEANWSEELTKFTYVPQHLTLYNPSKPYNYMWKNEARMRKVAACMAKGDCHPNALKFVVIGAFHCHIAVFNNYGGGEGIWCRSMIESLERQGYTVLIAGEDDWEYMAHLYRQFPDEIKVVLADDGTLDGRSGKGYEKYLKTKENPDGIPAWKFFRFSFYPNGVATVVGQQWSAIAEPEWKSPGDQGYRNMTYLGYPVANENPTVIPFSTRPVRAYILAKKMSYFYEAYGRPAMISREDITRAYYELRKDFPTFEFVASVKDDGDDPELADKPWAKGMSLPEGVHNLPPLNPEQFDYEVGNSRAMVGIGFPVSSPSPYSAMAQGVPFINPHAVNDRHDPDDPYTWDLSQHEWLRILKPPEGYQYPEGDYERFVGAIRTAMRTEMKPRLLERLTQKATDERLRKWVETDWRSEAERILQDRISGKSKESDKALGPYVGIFEM